MSSGKETVKVRFWGTRGSIPTPGPDTVKYGGNTSCIEVCCGKQGCYIFDSGSGIKLLGDHITLNGRKASTLNIFQSHLHWDHIQGLLFFKPLFDPNASIKFWCPDGIAAAPEEILDYQMRYVFFPVNRSALRANLEFNRITSDGVAFDEVKINACRVNHPGFVFAYRLSYNDLNIVYATDREPDENFENDAFIELCRDADLLIHDAQYSDEEYAESRKGWGHSPCSEAVRIARKANVKKLALYHHDPDHDDEFLDEMISNVRSSLRADDKFEVILARDKMEIEF